MSVWLVLLISSILGIAGGVVLVFQVMGHRASAELLAWKKVAIALDGPSLETNIIKDMLVKYPYCLHVDDEAQIRVCIEVFKEFAVTAYPTIWKVYRKFQVQQSLGEISVAVTIRSEGKLQMECFVVRKPQSLNYDIAMAQIAPKIPQLVLRYLILKKLSLSNILSNFRKLGRP